MMRTSASVLIATAETVILESFFIALTRSTSSPWLPRVTPSLNRIICLREALARSSWRLASRQGREKVGLTAGFETIDLGVDDAAQARHGFQVNDHERTVIESDDA